MCTIENKCKMNFLLTFEFIKVGKSKGRETFGFWVESARDAFALFAGLGSDFFAGSSSFNSFSSYSHRLEQVGS